MFDNKGHINPILLKIDIHVRYTMMLVCKNTIGICKSMQLMIFANTFVCTVLTDLLTQFC